MSGLACDGGPREARGSVKGELSRPERFMTGERTGESVGLDGRPGVEVSLILDREMRPCAWESAR